MNFWLRFLILLILVCAFYLTEKDIRDESGYTSELNVETLIHQCSVISNLIYGFDGIEESNLQKWISRIQALILFCNEEASYIRESLFNDIEKSFFFCEFLDVPIFSDDQ